MRCNLFFDVENFPPSRAVSLIDMMLFPAVIMIAFRASTIGLVEYETEDDPVTYLYANCMID